MTPERWQQIKIIVNSALAADIDARTILLQQSCADDLPLRLGAEALVSFHEDATRRLAHAPTLIDEINSQAPLSPDRWKQIEQLFQLALELDAAKRAAFLANACGGDEALRREVEELLVYQAAAGAVIGGAIQQAAGLLANSAGEKARFTSGMTLNKRYRIIGLLGRGGMGEVYRADDLKLGLPVALKFLTEKFSQNKAMLERFYGEVSMAHRVTHPNVCRVHDIGEVATSSGNLHFLSMEYVDGEDLSSLLRRIGRLPSDKAVEIATQICAGLAAAHEAGVLHRDLKPANIMLDGKGRARITDFGLAGFAEQIRGREVMAGTPAYMAPEQFAGKEVTVKSDIYALGLVLYEVFTGKRVFEAGSLDELKRLHESSAPTTPSSWVKDIDPLVERVILRCLEKDPSKRLASAKQVADALPGGDPLAAALAMGETPSPEMVAAAGPKTGMKPKVAIVCLAAVMVGLVIYAFLRDKTSWEEQVLRENSPDTLAHKSRDLINRLGYTSRPTDSAYGLSPDDDYLQDKSVNRWSQIVRGQPAATYFWYRQSPQYLGAKGWSGRGEISPDDPPLQMSGEAKLRLDPHGRLLTFQAVPPQLEMEGGIPTSPDWEILFAAAGLDPMRFTTTEPKWTPPTAFDARAAWTGTYPDQPEIPLRIEAAVWRGKPVYFQLVNKWTRPERVQDYQANKGQRIFVWIVVCLFISILLGAVLLARYNFRQGRGDRRGAFRLALFVFAVSLLIWLFGASHVPALEEITRFLLLAVSQALLWAGSLWLVYFALEPYMRRRWPDAIITWGRVLGGSLRDPLVARDVLVGILFSIFTELLIQFENLVRLWRDLSPVGPSHVQTLLGGRYLASVWLWQLIRALVFPLLFFSLMFLLRILTRRQWLSMSLFVLLYLMSVLPAISDPLVAVPFRGLMLLALAFCLLRFGFLTVAVATFVNGILYGSPITTDFSAWYAGNGLLALIAVMALAIYAFRTSLGGQKVFAGKLLEE